MHPFPDAYLALDFTLAQEAPPVPGASGQQQGQAAQGQPGDAQGLPAQGQPQQPQGFPPIFLFVIVLFVGMIIMQIFAGRKEKKKRQEMLGSLKRHDRVQTVGGIIGTISEIRENEVILKVDENNNTKIRMSRSSVQQILKSASGGATESEPSEVEPEKIGA